MKLQPKRNILRRWFWRIVGANGEVICKAQSYYSKSNCMRMVRKMQKELGLPIDGRYL